MRVLQAACFYRQAEQMPAAPGAYVLHIELQRPTKVTLAGRSSTVLPAGHYLYCGSAKGPGGLRARLTRHFRRRKRRRWHMDQLTARGRVVGSWVMPDGDECALVRRLSQLPTPVPGTGSSDCPTCRSHLLHWPAGKRQTDRLRRCTFGCCASG
jgi:Uri superfamily endonuclease